MRMALCSVMSRIEKLEVIERKTGDENRQLGPSEVKELRAKIGDVS